MNFVQALITALLAGVFAGLVSFLLNDRRDRTARRLTKIEEAAQAYFRWAEGSVTYTHSAYNIAAGRRTDFEWSEESGPLWDAAIADLAVAETLIGIYAPDLLHVIDYVGRPVAAAVNKLGEVRRILPTSATKGADILAQINQDNIQAVRGRKKGMTEIAVYCRDLANRPIRRANVAAKNSQP